jgi:hypothetical protein
MKSSIYAGSVADFAGVISIRRFSNADMVFCTQKAPWGIKESSEM